MGSAGGDSQRARSDVIEGVRRYFEARDYVRRGICLLNARCYEQAVEAFSAGLALNPDATSLPQQLARCYVGSGDYRAAAEQMATLVRDDSQDVASRIRHAMLLWKNGEPKGAIASLREGIAADPECAELHFQLGTLLASMDDLQEAELRFTTVLSIDARHVEAMISLAMCHAAAGDPRRALAHLRKAQSLQPQNARIGLLLAQAAKAVDEAGAAPVAVAVMPPPERPDDSDEMSALSDIIQEDPEFLDTFLDLSPGELDTDVEFYHLLERTVDHALKRQPDRPELRLRHGRVLDRLGRFDEAIESVERAVAIDPRHVQSLIELAKLYRKTQRVAEATARLEETLRLGVEYADVYLLLGNLYREGGRTDRAREAYSHALRINEHYAEARAALEGLPA